MRMSRKHVIVKRQSAIDDSGVDVFCSDKTGTLTEARIKLVREVDLGGQDSGTVMQMAQLNAAFETGLESPIAGGIFRDASHRICFCFTPKHASWLNQIEIWFSILVRRAPASG